MCVFVIPNICLVFVNRCVILNLKLNKVITTFSHAPMDGAVTSLAFRHGIKPVVVF